MDVLYAAASQKTGQCLITPLEILAKIPYKVTFSESDLPNVMNALAIDGYFEYEEANKKGEPIYLVSLKEKGLAYDRDKRTAKKKIYRRIATTIAFALLSYLVKLVIDAIIG
ncbi:MAG: hypothetical protein WC292_04885 [Clostridia bacterium]